MTFVEAPVGQYRNPHQVHGVLHVPQRAHSSFEYRAMRDVEMVSRLTQQLARFARFGAPCSVISTSAQPLKRFSRFHWDWPWRINTSLCMV